MAAPTAPTIAALLAAGEPLALPGVYDALSVTLAARAGFSAAFLSGFCLSATRLAQPDIGLITQTELLDAARRVAAAAPIPVIADADTGYGNAFNVERTVAELIAAGAAGCFLEDQVWPKRCGHMEGKRVVPLDEYLTKLRAALRVRAGTGFHVTARTDARAALGLDDAIARARAFADAGADAVFVEAPESVEEMARIRAALPPEVTLVANMVEGGKTPVRTVTECAAAGFRMVVLPLTGLLAAAHALRETYATLRHDGASGAVAGRMLGFAELNTLLGLEEVYRRERAAEVRDESPMVLDDFANDLERLLSGAVAPAAVRSRWTKSACRDVEDLMGHVDHFLSDEDIRDRDPAYREFQEEELRKLIASIRAGRLDEAKRITFLRRTA
jgi:methylisocitrate lyase